MAQPMTPSRILLFVVLMALPMFGDATASAPPTQTVIVPATADQATATVHLSGIDKPAMNDVQLSVPSSDEHIVPIVTITSVTGAVKDWDVALNASQLASFGETIATLLYKGLPKQIVRFSKPGLVVKTPEGGFAAKEGWKYGPGTPLTIVLVNLAATGYPVVRARLRFQDEDVCEATTDQSPNKSGDNSKCDDTAQWASFSVTKYTSTTLRVFGVGPWFRDPQTGYPKSAKRKGTLTLRYGDPTGGTTPTVYEQNIALEAQFEPSSLSTLGTLMRIAAGLLAGALLSLILRVTIPNYRRKRAIKEQFAQAAKATRAISDGVNSMLRVLLRVERLALQSSLRAVWISGPSFTDIAQRVEQGLATTKRKIDFAKRLDAARSKQSGLSEHDAPPTRLESIDRQIAAASDALLRDQLGEQDWVFIQQRLEAVDKLLGEPTQEEKEAFEALLVQRWKSIRDFFGVTDGKLNVPNVLTDMNECFPPAECLPGTKDSDGSQWVKNIGLTRADLQLSALALVRDFQFLAPSTGLSQEPWVSAKNHLKTLLQTPSIETLSAARLLLRELAQRIPYFVIISALRDCRAVIEVDPQIVSRNEKTRLFLRFRDPDFNSAAARLSVECEWELVDRPCTSIHRERGWEIYHYFENDVTQSEITVRFYYRGRPLAKVEEPLGGTPSVGGLVAESLLAGQEPARLEYKKIVSPLAQDLNSDSWWRFYRSERLQRFMPEALQLAAALLVPLAALAVAQAGQANGSHWWDLIGIGFGSETIRNILTGSPEQSSTPAQQSSPK